MVRGKDNIIKWYEFNKAPIWCICSSANNAQVLMGHGANIDEDDEGNKKKVNVNEAEALDQLKTALEILQPGRYILKVRNSSEQGTKWNKQTAIDSNDEGSQPATANVAAIGNPFGTSYVQTMVDAAVAKVQKEYEVKELQRQIDELKKEGKGADISPGVDKFLAAIAPHTESIIAGIFGNTARVGVQGFGKKPADHTNTIDVTAEEQTEAQKKAEAAAEKLFDRLPGNDVEKAALMEKLANIDESKLKMALSFL